MNPTPTPPAPGATLVLDSAAIERALKRIAHEIIERNPDLTKVALIGIPSRGVDIAQLALQYSVANEDMATCIVGSANPENVRKWVEWADQPIDQKMLGEVLEILRPIHNWFYIEGRPENNDTREVHP